MDPVGGTGTWVSPVPVIQGMEILQLFRIGLGRGFYPVLVLFFSPMVSFHLPAPVYVEEVPPFLDAEDIELDVF